MARSAAVCGGSAGAGARRVRGLRVARSARDGAERDVGEAFVPCEARRVIARDAQEVGVRERNKDGGAGGALGGEDPGEGGELVRREGGESRVVLEGTAEEVRVASSFDGGRDGRERPWEPLVADVRGLTGTGGLFALWKVLSAGRERFASACRWHVSETDYVFGRPSETGVTVRGGEGVTQSALCRDEGHCRARGGRRAPCQRKEMERSKQN